MQVWQQSAWAFHQATRLNLFQFNLMHLCQCPLPGRRGLTTRKWQAPSLAHGLLSYCLFGGMPPFIRCTKRAPSLSQNDLKWKVTSVSADVPQVFIDHLSAVRKVYHKHIYIFPTCVYRDSKRFLFSNLWTSNIFSYIWKVSLEGLHYLKKIRMSEPNSQ